MATIRSDNATLGDVSHAPQVRESVEDVNDGVLSARAFLLTSQCTRLARLPHSACN
jgi:hypothetical protein